MRRYETIFILRPDTGDSQIKETIKRLEGIVSQGGGEVIESEEWGSRELAYLIRRERRGYYVRLDYVALGPVMNEVERNLKIAEPVLRYLSVMVEPEADVAKIRADIDARNRRTAEAKAAAEARQAALAAQAAEKAAAEAATNIPDAPEEMITGDDDATEPNGGQQSH
ncbi:MAG TPA: 30S ribosomal protein S6 [Candidatus Binataceae bacterium]